MLEVETLTSCADVQADVSYRHWIYGAIPTCLGESALNGWCGLYHDGHIYFQELFLVLILGCVNREALVNEKMPDSKGIWTRDHLELAKCDFMTPSVRRGCCKTTYGYGVSSWPCHRCKTLPSRGDMFKSVVGNYSFQFVCSLVCPLNIFLYFISLSDNQYLCIYLSCYFNDINGFPHLLSIAIGFTCLLPMVLMSMIK